MAWTPNREELAWAAGFFDGEGSTYLDPRPRLSISQNDVVTLERFRDAVGLGTVHVQSAIYGRAKKPVHQFRISGWRPVQAAVAMLWPWLSPIKKAQASRALNQDRARVAGLGRRRGQHFRLCGQAHSYGVADCPTCSRIYWRTSKRRARQEGGQ